MTQVLAGIGYNFVDQQGNTVAIKNFRVSRLSGEGRPLLIEGTLERMEDLAEYKRGYDDGAGWGYETGDLDGFLLGCDVVLDEIT